MYTSGSICSLGFNKMEDHLKELLFIHRNKFASLDAERLIPSLREHNILSADDIEAIRRDSLPSQKMHALLDLLPSKGSQAFQTLCLALENTSPHLLTIMLLGASQRMPFFSSRQGSISAGLTSDDSECEEKKPSPPSIAPPGGGEGGGGGGGRALPPSSSSPQPPPPQQSSLVSTHDYNMEQSNVKLLKAELKIVTKDRDVMKKELKKAMRDRDEAVKRLTSPHHIDQSNYGTLNKHGGVSVSDKSLASSREFESLNLRYEKALMDIQLLQKQNVEVSRKYETASKDAEYYRKQERATYTSMQNLRLQYDEVLSEKQKLENELTSLQGIMEDDRKEIADLRRQQQPSMRARRPLKRQEAMTQEDSGEAINQLYITTLRKYEALKDEYDSLRKRYSDIAASHSNNISKLELAQEEITRLKKQYDDVVREKNCLKQQCTGAIRQWDTALRDKNQLQEELLKLREKNEEMVKEMNTNLIQTQNLSKECKRLQSERNAAMQEYTLVMSERDTVHKEMDKLQEELNIASKKIKSIEQCTIDNTKERDSMQLQLETLKREIAASLHDRDKAIRDCNELRERYGAEEDRTKEWENSYKDYDTYKQERELKLKEGTDLVSASHEMFTKAQKERLDNLDQANQEIDRLRKTVEELQSDLEEAKREAEVSKRRRDWAFSERDKIVLERESIRAHCDKLRHERDRAVSDLAEALRDSDDMMKQRNEAAKQLKELKEKLEAEQEKSVAIRHVGGAPHHNSSRDSAIDTDLQEWEIETLHMQIGILSEKDLGFEVSGGAEDPHYGSSDGAVYISAVAKDSPFEGKLRLHDQLIRINGVDCQGVSQSSVYNAFLKCGGLVQVTVRRRRNGGRTLHTTHLHCPNPAHHGLILQTGIYIANILPGSPAAREGNLAIGDRVLNVNGKPVESSVSCEEAQSLLDSGGEVLQLTTLKSIGSSSLSAPLSSSSSGHNMTEDDKAGTAPPPPSSSSVTSHSKESCYYSLSPGRGGVTRADLVAGLKLTARVGVGDERRLGSSERVVYNVTKPPPSEDKSSTGGGPWGQLRNIVKPRRHSKERGDGRSESREKEAQPSAPSNSKKKGGSGTPLPLDRERDSAIAQLDSILDGYHYKPEIPASGTTKRSKKKEKEKSGGTWPKYRGGAITLSDINMGTIKNSMGPPRKERPPLSMYLPTSSSASVSECHDSKASYQESYALPKQHGSNTPGAGDCVVPRGMTALPLGPRTSHVYSVYRSIENAELAGPYKLNEFYSTPLVQTGGSYPGQASHSQQQGGSYPGQPIYSSLASRMGSVEHKDDPGVDKEHQDHHSSPDTSLDFSVRSGNVGKEELEYYVKKNRVKYPPNDSESNSLLHQPSSLPPVYLSRPSPLHHIGERIPSNSRIPHSHTGLYSPPSGGLRVSPAFTAYSPLSFYPHSHAHAALSSYSSPSYSTPPPLPMLGGSPNFLSPSRSGDSILSSPGPDRDPRDVRGYYENQISSSPNCGAGLMLGGGVPGVGFYHSTSPSIDAAGCLKRGAIHPHHPHHSGLLRASSDEPPLLPSAHPHVSLLHHTGPPTYHDYQRSVATIPRKKDEERIRIPSNSSMGVTKASVTGGRSALMERGCDKNSGRESPTSTAYAITQISHSVHGQHLAFPLQKKVQPGDIRSIDIEKESEPLGIQIRCLENGGVYVSSVTLNSIAEQVGLCVGDQLLEVCGINMRSANKQLASTVLSQCGNSVTMLVQHNPEKYHEAEGWDESSSGGSIVMGSRSGTPTPQNSPKTSRTSPIGGEDDDDSELAPSSNSTLRAPLDPRDSLPPSARSTLTRPQATHILNALKRQDTLSRRSNNSDGSATSEPKGGSAGSGAGSTGGGGKGSTSASPVTTESRHVYIEMKKGHNLGIQMVGGNALGIFIHAILPDTPAAKSDLRVGDRILEFNEVDLRHATAEQAACELSKPSENINMLVHWDYKTYSEIKDQPGDCFYVKALFAKVEQSDSTDLRFQKDDILYVDNTLYNNMLGQWRAWLVTEDGHKKIWGTIPSKDKVEEEIMSQRNLSEIPMDSSRRGSTSARRSFFRRKKHSRSSSRDSKELASFSDASLNAYAEATPLPDDPLPLSYLRVERLDYLVRRPLLLVGPLWEAVTEKLMHDFPHKFLRCIPEIRFCSLADMEAGVQNGDVIDYRRRGSHFETTLVSQVKEICDKSYHGILDIGLGAVERLHRHNIYPIVLVLKFKHHKHIRDIIDVMFPTHERLSQKEAKEMFDITNKMEHDYKHFISGEVAAGVNMSYICAQMKAIVDDEQSKTLWVPAGSLS